MNICSGVKRAPESPVSKADSTNATVLIAKGLRPMD